MRTVEFIQLLLNNCRNAEPINNKSDYIRVKNWVKKANSLFKVFTILAVLMSIVISRVSNIFLEMPSVLVMIAYLFVGLFTSWGFVAMFMNFKLLIKSMWHVGVNGYKVGEQIVNTHVNVTHEYGNTYKVTTNTENQGCAMAAIYGFINLFVWAFLCVYICPFLMFKKISESKRNLREAKNI